MVAEIAATTAAILNTANPSLSKNIPAGSAYVGKHLLIKLCILSVIQHSVATAAPLEIGFKSEA